MYIFTGKQSIYQDTIEIVYGIIWVCTVFCLFVVLFCFRYLGVQMFRNVIGGSAKCYVHFSIVMLFMSRSFLNCCYTIKILKVLTD